MWGARVKVQISRMELHIHVYLDWVRVEFLSYIKINKKINKVWTAYILWLEISILFLEEGKIQLFL